MASELSYLDPMAPEGCGVMTDSCLKDWKCVATTAPHVDDEEPSGGFDCNICLDTVQDPVVTLCGHLYCWPCIYRWLQVQGTSPDLNAPSQPQCPVCKSKVSQETLVPLYGRGGSTKHSNSKAHNLGVVVPRRPCSPTCGVDLLRSTGMISSPCSTRRPQQDHSRLSQQHPIYHNSQQGSPHPIYHNSQQGSPQTTGMIGEMVLARVFGSPCEYQNSYNLAGTSIPRVRRHMMETDKSLSRICFFLLCCLVSSLLLF